MDGEKLTIKIPDRQGMIQALQNNTVRVTFTKANANTRVMLCTLQSNFLPPMTPRKTDRVIPPNEEVIRVVDLELGEWRSFRVDSVVDFVIDTAPAKS